MKKSIATAVLFAAATFANATTPDAIDWQNATITLDYNNTSASGNVGSDLDAGRAGFKSIMVGEQSFTTIDSSKYDWQVSFQLELCTHTGDLSVFTTDGGSNGSGFRIIVKKDSDGSNYTTALEFSTTSDGNKSDYLTGTNFGSDTTDISNNNSLINCELTDTTKATIALTWIANEKKLYLSVEDNALDAGTPNSTKWISYDCSDSEKFAYTSLDSVTNISSTPEGTVFWSNGNAGNNDELHNITLKIHAIPEPSAFGLLAGLGAIALVVSRRRRKH